MGYNKERNVAIQSTQHILDGIFGNDWGPNNGNSKKKGQTVATHKSSLSLLDNVMFGSAYRGLVTFFVGLLNVWRLFDPYRGHSKVGH